MEMAAGDWWCPQGWRPDLEANTLMDWFPGDEVLLSRTRAMEDVWAPPAKRRRTDTRIKDNVNKMLSIILDFPE